MSFLVPKQSLCKCDQLVSAVVPRDFLRTGPEKADYLFLFRFNYPRTPETPYLETFISVLRGKGYNFSEVATLNSLGCVPEDRELPDSLIPHKTCAKYNTSRMIKEISPKVIFVEEEALIAIVGETYIKTKHFYNKKYFNTWFWAPQYNAWVFPFAKLDSWMGVIGWGNKKEFRSWDNYHRHFFESQLVQAKRLLGKHPPDIKFESIVVDKPNEFLKQYIGKGIKVAVDTETNTYNPVRGSIFCITICVGGNKGYLLKWKDIDITILNDFLRTNKCVFANGKFDCCHFRAQGIKDVKIYSDVNYLAHFLCSSIGNSLKANTFRHLSIGGYDKDLDDFNSKYKIKDYETIPEDLLAEYATTDACSTYFLEDILLSQLTEAQKKLFFGIFIPFANEIVGMELEGLPVDLEYMSKYREKCEERVKQIEEEIYKDPRAAGVNLDSGQQLGQLFKKLGAKIIDITETGEIATGAESIQRWADDNVPFAKLILEHKELSKLLSSYLSKTSKKGLYTSTWGTSRAHGSYNLTGTAVTRLSIQGAALQTLPTKSNKEFAKVFNAGKDRVYLESDYSSFHVRLVAVYSKDENLLKMFSRGSTFDDVHSQTAASVFADMPIEEFVRLRKEGTEEQKKQLNDYRNSSKGVNFGYLYLRASSSFARDTLMLSPVLGGWTKDRVAEFIRKNKLEDLRERLAGTLYKKMLDEDDKNYLNYWACADHIRNQFFSTYPGILKWGEKQIEFVIEHGYVENLLGFRAYFPEITYPNHEKDNSTISDIRSSAVNYPVITLESAIMHDNMVRIQKRIKESRIDCKMVLQIHDSLLFDVHTDCIKDAGVILKEEFERDLPIYDGVVIKAEASYSQVWGGSEDYPKQKLF